MQQFIFFEDDWVMVEVFVGYCFVFYQFGMVCVYSDVLKEFGFNGIV